TRAYTQQAVCAPSRNTLMTGMRPDALGITDLPTFFRTKAPDVVTLSQHFMQNGYQSEGMGKVYHTGHGNRNDTLSWSIHHWTPYRIINKREPITSGDTAKLHTCVPTIGGKKIPWLRSTMPEHFHNDAMVASHAMERMEALKDTSFFLAVGLVKPHLPFVVPSRYWDLYNASQIIVPSPDKPDQYPSFSFSNWGELRSYHGMPAEGLLGEEDAINMIHGYYACVSFIDAQIGRIIGRLKELGLYENTIIVLWGDHGWKLGDYGEWCKHTNYEIDTRIPLMVRDPREKSSMGWKSDAIVETVDIYPTLCELVGLDLPDHLQGSSFATAMQDDEMEWEDVAFSQYPRSTLIDGQRVKLMGYSMRTSDYRLTRWINIETRETVDTELYDHSEGEPEMVNLATRGEFKNLVLMMNEKLEKEYEKEHGRSLKE
ncbi:sulfatase, partial [Bacteroidota bacterium]